MILSVIGMVIVGLVVGALAHYFYSDAIALGLELTLLLGIAGSLVGGVLTRMLWKTADGKFHRGGLVMSVAGAVILIWAYLNVGR